ncbi:MAG: serine/threonine-protein phosphatase [Clostridia bacterium]|nr:serine/threonine-protein phosphatase [Clostridia bacterium]
MGTKTAVSERDAFPLEIGNAQHQGARNYQEDYFGFSRISAETFATKGALAVLCDGMGGLSGGRETAVRTVTEILDAFERSDFRYCFDANIRQVIETVAGRIHDSYNKTKFTTGCTLVTAYIYDRKLYWACAGDSRLYLIRGGNMYAVNEDHDSMNQKLDEFVSGKCTWSDVMSNQQKDSLTSFIGAHQLKLDISHTGLALTEGDMVLLCSDGIYNSLSECEMLRCIDCESAQQACDLMVERIVKKAKRAQDNMTVMLIRV